MSDEPPKKRLGRGLAALIGEMDEPLGAETVTARADTFVPVEFVQASKNNPRRHFDPEELKDLAASIARHGIVQPLVVRSHGGGRYEIIAGERRWRAAQQAGLVEIPIIIRDVDDRTALELAIVENVQRADLNPLEEAMGYEQLIADHGYTQNDLGDIVGKSRSHVANSLRLLKLPEGVRTMLAGGSLSAGHARAIVSTGDPEALARQIVSKGLSVREAEKLAQKDGELDESGSRRVNHKPAKDADTLALERSLSDVLGLAVEVKHKVSGGHIRIDYTSLDQLDDVCRRLGAKQ